MNNKIIFIVGGIILLLIILVSAPRNVRKDSFTVKGVKDGNTLVLENGYEIVLLGVAGTEKSAAYLQDFVGEDIRIIMDSTSPRLGKTKSGETKRIYGYIKCDRECLNSEILKHKLSDICMMPNLHDSLNSYLAYSGHEGEYVFPDPQPVPGTPDEASQEEDDDVVTPVNPNKKVKPHKGSKSSGWSSNCSDNCDMLADVADFNDPTTRNFAIKLASKSPGDYNFGQICAIFDYLYNKWKYVNDPSGSEYVAKASETVSQAGLAGDCDDFAVCMASCIIAIGGDARINTAWGSQGGHAFTEVDVTGLSESTMRSQISKMFSQYSIPRICTRQDNGRTWLNLDWQAGYPGGPYFDFTQITTYQRTGGNTWVCR